MNNRDYFIAMDENGQPYIAHARYDDGAKPSGRKDTKYYAKVGSGDTTRYFYSKDEYDAYMNNQNYGSGFRGALARAGARASARAGAVAANAGRSISNVADRAQQTIGNAGATARRYADVTIGAVRNAADRLDSRDERAELDAAKAAYDKAKGTDNEIGAYYDLQTAQRNYDKTARAGAERAATRIGTATRNAATRIGTAARNAADRIDSRDERAELDAAQAAYDRVKGMGTDDELSAYYRLQDAKNAYNKTVRGTGERVGNSVRNTATNVGNGVRNAATRIGTAARNAADRIDSRDERAELDAAQAAYDKAKGTDDEIGAYYDLQTAKRNYDQTVRGTGERVGNNVRNAVTNVGTGVRNAATNVGTAARNTATNVGNSVRNAADRIDSRDERAELDAAQAAYDRVKGMGTDDELSAYYRLQDAKNAYNKTVRGTAERAGNSVRSAANTAATTAGNTVRGAAENVGNSVRSAATTVGNAVRGAAENVGDRVSDTFNNVTGRNARFSEYTEDDKDFDENNYSRQNHVRGTDFYTFKRDDGRSVVLEEDMKWVMPKGIDAKDPVIQAALKQVARQGQNTGSYDEWLDMANDIINDAIAEVRENNKDK